MDYLEKIMPFLEKGREFVQTGADFLANALNFEPNHVYLALMLIISVILAKKILQFFYTTLEGRWAYWAILTGILYWILAFL